MENTENPENPVNLRSFERIVFVNPDTGEASETPKEGFEKKIVPKYIYQDGLPLQYQIDLKDAIFGQVGEDKATFKPVNELIFTPLAVYEFGNVCMYPRKDPVTGQRTCKRRNMVSVIGYIPNFPHIVSFLLPTWTASNFLKEYKKSGRVTPAGIPVTSPLQLQFKAIKYQETSASGIKVWALKFDVQIMPPKYFKELAEFSQNRNFYALEHFVEVIANNDIDLENPPIWLRKVRKMLGNFEELLEAAYDRRLQYSDNSEYANYQMLEEVPREKVDAYKALLRELFEDLTSEERMYFASVGYDVSKQEFKEKGFALKAIQKAIADGTRKPLLELPF